MNLPKEILRSNEEAVLRLRALYHSYGYTRYKVSKFEEYDLYAHNKSFLVCENILTFTDTNGKLMALKPDVTLSIVKNVGAEETATHKLCYSETVYRTAGGAEGFREIGQTGLECIGKIDPYLTGEVLMLAERSLSLIGDRYVLDLSHMGFLLGLLASVGVEERDSGEVLALMANKNLPGLSAFLSERELDGTALLAVTSIYEPLETALPKLAPYVQGERMQAAYNELCGISRVAGAWGILSSLYVDFSIAGDRNYYDGIIFRGYVNGIPEAILLGGRYDSLLRKMGKRAEAIGFAVYPELIDALDAPAARYDVDVVLLYGESDDVEDVIAAVKALEKDGKTARAECGNMTSTRCAALYKMKGREAVLLETVD